MNTQLLAEAMSGKLSRESVAELTRELASYAKGEAFVLPSASAYQRRVRDESIVMVYQFLSPITHAEFFRLFTLAKRQPDPDDTIMLLLHNVHKLNDSFGLNEISESTVKRACA